METQVDKDLDQLLNEHFAGRVVRKDLTKLIKEGANVPVYVLEYLLGMYCASDDSEVIEQGLKNVKKILAENYVRPDEAEKVKSLVRERGTYKVIDRVTVRLNEKKDRYEASFSRASLRQRIAPHSQRSRIVRSRVRNAMSLAIRCLLPRMSGRDRPSRLRAQHRTLSSGYPKARIVSTLSAVHASFMAGPCLRKSLFLC